jgi:hypothetical protein
MWLDVGFVGSLFCPVHTYSEGGEEPKATEATGWMGCLARSGGVTSRIGGGEVSRVEWGDRRVLRSVKAALCKGVQSCCLTTLGITHFSSSINPGQIGRSFDGGMDQRQ